MLSAHLADLLSTHQRCGDSIETTTVIEFRTADRFATVDRVPRAPPAPLLRKGHFRALSQAGSQFIDGRSISHLTNLAEQIVGKRHFRQSRARLQASMQGIGDIANFK